jgi:hypothetical protein
MIKHFPGIILLLFLGTFSWGQGTKEPYDTGKSIEEQDIMCGILNTKLSYLMQELKMSPDVNNPNILSFYLEGQGIVFMIPISSFRTLPGTFFPSPSSNWTSELSQKTESLRKEILARNQELVHAKEQLSGNASAQSSQKSSAESGKGDAATAAFPSPPVPPDKSLAERISELQKTIDELNEKVRGTSQEATTIIAQTYSKAIEELPPILIETLANYGDSLTIIKPQEHINFVLNTNERPSKKNKSIVISARKSWITDYKAGRLTLDAFKQKVLQYSE